MAACAGKPDRYDWQVAEPFAGAETLGRRLGVGPLVAQLLANRGLTDVDAARAFLEPRLTDLHPPETLPGVPAAAERLAAAARDGQKIVLYGDYDVDGITGVAILHACLKMLGADVDFYVPHRLEEGYGVNAEAVGKLVADGAKLLVTIDCGIGAVEPLAAAAAGSADVIVTDHHSLPDRLPEAATIVHPALEGGRYGNADLSGAGVAFKLAWQLARETCGADRVDEPLRELLLEATCLAALGTIADVVPLRGENRALAAFGLRGLPATKHVGIRALIEAAHLTGEKLDAYHVGFVLAPRLNACGRMGHARLAVELLTGADEARAGEIARYLNAQNTQRQKVEKDITDQAVEMALAAGMDDDAHRAIVLASEQWHGGVIGIVASRLVDRFARPAVLIAVNGDGAQGSARSIPGFHMRDALAACGEHLLSFGGHAMAGGLRIDPARIDAFAEAFAGYAQDHITAEQMRPHLRIDAECPLAALRFAAVEGIARLAPFGQGNPRPVVAVRDCALLTAPQRMGRSGQTLGLLLGQGNTRLRAVGFGMGDRADRIAAAGRVDVAGEPRINTFQGRSNVELMLRDVRCR